MISKSMTKRQIQKKNKIKYIYFSDIKQWIVLDEKGNISSFNVVQSSEQMASFPISPQSLDKQSSIQSNLILSPMVSQANSTNDSNHFDYSLSINQSDVPLLKYVRYTLPQLTAQQPKENMTSPKDSFFSEDTDNYNFDDFDEYQFDDYDKDFFSKYNY